MRSRARRLPALLAATVLAGVLATPGTVQAQQELGIKVGGFFRNGAPGEGLRFYAPELNVHSGDTLTFQNRGFHTATLLPSSVTDVQQWIQENQAGLDKPYSPFVLDPDDIDSDPGASAEKPPAKFNNAVAFPDPPDCGNEGQPPCDYSGDTLLNSGAFFETWSATINAPAGTSAWVLCLLHQNMTLKFNVVDDAAATTTQEEIDSYKKEQKKADAAAALKKHLNLLNKHVKKNGKWQAWNGYDGEHYSLIAMYPERLEIKKGQSVEWNHHLLGEMHTVTFPKDKARDVFRRDFLPGCDPDEEGPGPDNPPDIEAPPFCNDPAQLEVDIAAKTVHLFGDGKFKGRDYENSGVRGPGAPSYTLKFTKRSDSKGYKYMCLTHGPFQSGTVEVR